MRKIPILTLPVVAAAPIKALRFVGFDQAQIAVAGKVAMGVADYEAATGKKTAVHVLGTAPVESGGPIGAGDLVKSDAQGRAVPHAGAGAVQGRALHAVAAAGVPVETLLLPPRDPIA